MEAAVTADQSPQTVKPDTILHELSELWNNMTKPQPGEAPEEYSSGSLRACAMTLNVFVNEEDDPAGLDKTLRRSCTRIPTAPLSCGCEKIPER